MDIITPLIQASPQIGLYAYHTYKDTALRDMIVEKIIEIDPYGSIIFFFETKDNGTLFKRYAERMFRQAKAKSNTLLEQTSENSALKIVRIVNMLHNET